MKKIDYRIRLFLTFVFLTSLFSACSVPLIIPYDKRVVVGTYISPNKKDQITILRTNSSSTRLEREAQYIDLKIKVNNRNYGIGHIYAEKDFHGDDNYSLEEMFPSIGWRGQNLFVLGFGAEAESITRKITIRNDAAETVDSILIFADELYLVTNILPSSTFDIPVRWNSKAMRRCSAHATVHFANGKVIRRNYSDNRFSLDPKSDSELDIEKPEKREDCVNGNIIVRNSRIDYRVRVLER